MIICVALSALYIYIYIYTVRQIPAHSFLYFSTPTCRAHRSASLIYYIVYILYSYTGDHTSNIYSLINYGYYIYIYICAIWLTDIDCIIPPHQPEAKALKSGPFKRPPPGKRKPNSPHLGFRVLGFRVLGFSGLGFSVFFELLFPPATSCVASEGLRPGDSSNIGARQPLGFRV